MWLVVGWCVVVGWVDVVSGVVWWNGVEEGCGAIKLAVNEKNEWLGG